MPAPFRTEVEVVDNGPGVWKTALVHIVHDEGGVSRRIGSYARNHAGWCDSTFHPFLLEGRWYALYSPDYTATRVMELPSCRDIAGEESCSNGFCPVDYYVPFEHPNVIKAGRAGSFGFVAGCIWGDYSSWKIQYLDLSGIAAGALVRKELFGYVAIPRSGGRLSECISLSGYDPPKYEVVDLSVEVRFDLRTGEHRDQF